MLQFIPLNGEVANDSLNNHDSNRIVVREMKFSDHRPQRSTLLSRDPRRETRVRLALVAGRTSS